MRPVILFFITLISAVAVSHAAGKTITIMHKTTSVRAAQQFFAPTVATAKYGDQLQAIDEEGGWYKVSVGKKTGWVHSSATKSGAVKVAARSFNKSSVSSQDVALAGKGFNEKVEKKYKKDNPDMNFAAVDKMEKVNVSDGQIKKFLAEGKLSPKGGK